MPDRNPELTPARLAQLRTARAEWAGRHRPAGDYVMPSPAELAPAAAPPARTPPAWVLRLRARFLTFSAPLRRWYRRTVPPLLYRLETFLDG